MVWSSMSVMDWTTWKKNQGFKQNWIHLIFNVQINSSTVNFWNLNVIKPYFCVFSFQTHEVPEIKTKGSGVTRSGFQKVNKKNEKVTFQCENVHLDLFRVKENISIRVWNYFHNKNALPLNKELHGSTKKIYKRSK